MRWNTLPGTALDEYASHWDRLNDDATRSPLLEYRFVRTALEHFGSGKERLAVATAEDSGDVLALVLLTKGKAFQWSTFQPAQSPLAPLVKSDALEIRVLALSLSDAMGPGPTIVGLSQLDPDMFPRPGHEGRLSTLDYIETARITITGTFDEYWAARGKNLRQNLRKQRNRLSRAGVETRLVTLDQAEDAAAGVGAYGALEQASWKGSGGTAVAADNAQGAFYTALMREYLATGDGQIVQYYFDDALVASDLCVSGYGTFVVLKTTYSEEQHKFSPALLMREHLFPELFASGTCTRIEFYGRVMEWHRRWSEEIRTLYHVNVYRYPLVRSARELVRKFF